MRLRSLTAKTSILIPGFLATSNGSSETVPTWLGMRATQSRGSAMFFQLRIPASLRAFFSTCGTRTNSFRSEWFIRNRPDLVGHACYSVEGQRYVLSIADSGQFARVLQYIWDPDEFLPI